MPIPDDALAAIGLDGRGFVSDSPSSGPAGVWRLSRGSEPVRELTMASEFLDMSLTILQFEGSVDLAEVEYEGTCDQCTRQIGRRKAAVTAVIQRYKRRVSKHD
ncbi:MAG: hypothetical protein OXD38_07655 [Aestuariivita sp.]|nr:hypothetical protein [Aestuariivita sp.]